MIRRNWAEEELIKTLLLYFDIPFGQLHAKNPKIVKLAGELGRTPNAVALKMVNFASLDPTIEQKGMSNVSVLDRKVWDKVFSNIDYYLSIEYRNTDGFNDCSPSVFVGLDSTKETEKNALRKVRIGQRKFRDAVLASYNARCSISGIRDKRLLVASHIAPWATNEGRRLDPRNGICFNALLDRAFDAGVIAISDDYNVMFSSSAQPETISIISETGTKFQAPDRFRPDRELLRLHRERFGFD